MCQVDVKPVSARTMNQINVCLWKGAVAEREGCRFAVTKQWAVERWRLA